MLGVHVGQSPEATAGERVGSHGDGRTPARSQGTSYQASVPGPPAIKRSPREHADAVLAGRERPRAWVVRDVLHQRMYGRRGRMVDRKAERVRRTRPFNGQGELGCCAQDWGSAL